MKVIKKLFISSLCATIMMPTHLNILAMEDSSETTPSAFGETAIESNSDSENIVTKDNFPDENFRKVLLGKKDSLTKQDLENITTLDLSMKNIRDLKGIEYLTNLTSLNVSLNALSSLDLSKNTKLTWLDASNNALTTVDKLPSSLKYLNLFGNYTITSVDVKNMSELWYLNVAVNALTSIDLSGNPKLTHLFLEENQLTTLDLSNQTILNESFFRVYDNLLTKIVTPKLARFIPVSLFYVQEGTEEPWTLNGEEISEEGTVLFDGGILRKGSYETDDITETSFPDANFRKALIQAGITDNNAITAITDLDLSMQNISDLTGIEKFTNLKTLNVSVNKIKSIDCLKTLTNLTWLDASNNMLTTVNALPVSLKYLNVFGNYTITNIDVSNLTQLWYLNVAVNSLESLDVTSNKELTQLYVEENKLTSLDLSNQMKLDETFVKLYQNQLVQIITPNLGRSVPVSLFFVQDESEEAWMVKGRELKESDTVLFDGSILTRGASETDYITSSNFPDENFRKALIRLGITSKTDVESTTKLDVSMQNISNLKGIELFTNLETLNASVNRLTSLDCLQSLSTLTWLDVSNNELKGISNLPTSLKYLDASSNYGISEVEVSDLKNLWYLNLAVNSLTSIDLSSNSALTHLFLQENKLTRLDLSKQTKLDPTFFELYKNELKEVVTPTLAQKVAASAFYQQKVEKGYETIWKVNGRSLLSADDVVFDGSTLTSEVKGKEYKIIFHANDKTSTTKETIATFGEEKVLDANTFTKIGCTFAGWAYKSNATSVDFTDQGKLKIEEYPSNGNIDLYAVWKANEYTVKFHANNGTDTVTEQTFTYDVQKALDTNTFTSEGKSFVGWSTTKTGTKNYFNGQYVKNLTSAENGVVDLYAVWDDITYTVTFDVNGGKEATSSQTVSYKGQVSEPSNPTRIGYTFIGWMDTNLNNSYDFNQEVTSNITLKAMWKANSYTISYNANGASGSMDKQELLYDEENILKANTFTKEGYHFIGWSLSTEGEVVYKNQQSVSNITTENGKNIVLYAQWEKDVKTVVLFNSGLSETKKVAYGETMTLPTLTKMGYKFLGWNVNGKSLLTSKDFTVTDNVNLYANWEVVVYNIKYVDGITNMKTILNPTTYTITSSTITLKNPTRTGYIFGGWYSDSKYRTKVTQIKTGSTGNRTLYAKWTPISYKINYQLNGGKVSGNPTTYNITSKTVTLKNPTRTGYIFGGWYSDSKYRTKVTQIKTGSTGNRTLYAKWTPISYKINYQLNGGKVSGNPTTYNITSKTVTLKNPTRTGYIFGGWYSDAKYRTKVTQIKTGSTGNRILYAKWIKVSKPGAVRLKSVKNNAKSKINITYQSVNGSSGYEIAYSTSSKFTKSTTKYTSSKCISNLKKGKTYYIKVRAYKKDSTGRKVYGNYGNVMKIKITK